MSNENSDNPVLEPEKLFYPDDAEAETESLTEEAEISEEEPEETESEVAESDELEEESVESEDEEGDSFESYIELDDGREITIKQIKEWEQGNLRHSDYTKKTQNLADERRAFEQDRDGAVEAAVSKKMEVFKGQIAELELLIKEADDTVNLEELREYDPSEYLKQKELRDKRVKAAEESKKMLDSNPLATDPNYLKEQQEILARNNPTWINDKGETTEAHKEDLKTLAEYLDSKGYTKQDQGRISSARDWQTLIDASKYRKSLKKVEGVKKKVKKVPITTKQRNKVPKAAKNKSAADIFYPNS